MAIASLNTPCQDLPLFQGLFSISSSRVATQHPDFQYGKALLGWESAERSHNQGRRGMATGDTAGSAAQHASQGLARVFTSPSQYFSIFNIFFLILGEASN